MTYGGGLGDEVSPGAAGRRVVSAAAPLAFVLALGGAVTGGATESHALAYALMAAGVGTGVWCLWHGARNTHERGRAFAVPAVLVGVLVTALMLWSRYRTHSIL